MVNSKRQDYIILGRKLFKMAKNSGVWPRISENYPMMVRLIAAAMLTYLIVQLRTPGKSDLTGVFASMLIVQTSVVGTIKTSFERIAATSFGVGIAVFLSSKMGVNALSLFVGLIIALLVAEIFNFKDNKLEIPISALLILTASQYGLASEQRIYNTLIGITVGIFISFFFPLRPKLYDAINEINTLAIQTAENAQWIAEKVVEEPQLIPVDEDNLRAVSIINDTSKAREAVKSSRQSMLLNFGMDKKEKNHKLDLMEAIDSLEHCVTMLQKIIVSLEVQSHAFHRLDNDARNDLRAFYSSVMMNASYAIRCFATLIDAPNDTDYRDFYNAIKRLKDSRVLLIEIVTTPSIPTEISVTVQGILDSIEGIVHELDLELLGEYEVKTVAAVKYYVHNISEPLTRGKLRKVMARNKYAKKIYTRMRKHKKKK